MGKKVRFVVGLDSGCTGVSNVFDIEEELGIVQGEDYDTEEELEKLLEEELDEWAYDQVWSDKLVLNTEEEE